MTKKIDVQAAAETAEYRYVWGWHCVGEAQDFRDDKVFNPQELFNIKQQ